MALVCAKIIQNNEQNSVKDSPKILFIVQPWIAIFNNINKVDYFAKAAMKSVSHDCGRHPLCYLVNLVWESFENGLNFTKIWTGIHR